MTKHTVDRPFEGLFKGKSRLAGVDAPVHLDHFVKLREGKFMSMKHLPRAAAANRSWMTDQEAEFLSQMAGTQSDIYTLPFKEAKICPIEVFKQRSYDITQFKYGEEQTLLKHMQRNGETPVLNYQSTREVYCVRSPDPRKGFFVRDATDRYGWGHEWPSFYNSEIRMGHVCHKLIHDYNTPAWIYPVLLVPVSETKITDAFLRQANLIDFDINRTKTALFPEFAFTMQQTDELGNTRYYMPQNTYKGRMIKNIRHMNDVELCRWRYDKASPDYFSSMFHICNHVMRSNVATLAPDILENLTVIRHKCIFGKPYQVVESDTKVHPQYPDRILWDRVYSDGNNGKIDDRKIVLGNKPLIYGMYALEKLKLELGDSD